ncbi:MAG: RDD family protein [Rhodospirillales bacterium]|nr:RDD family protein [Rhodospirillales bacterium]
MPQLTEKGNRPGRSAPNLRDTLTPEGVVLKIQLADPWERAAAVILDLAFILIMLLVLICVFYFSGFFTAAPFTAFAILILVVFIVRSFYFIFFELRWRGVTPGKRLLGLRVMNRTGGPLRSDAIFARNLLREIELFIPISILVYMQGSHDEGLSSLFSMIWLCIFIFFPFFNKDRMRAGDMVAGTWVIRTPKSALLEDIATTSQHQLIRQSGSSPQSASNPVPQVSFSDAQLDVYGIFELQTLETVLRVKGPDLVKTQNEVAMRIQRKIGWPENAPGVSDRAFLTSFYAALRARLEAKMLLGKRRENKYDAS